MKTVDSIHDVVDVVMNTADSIHEVVNVVVMKTVDSMH